jgi:hypothetical protein
MTARIRHAFEPDLVLLPLASLLPVKQVTERMRRSHKYKVIAASIAEIGVIEPLIVHRQPDPEGRHVLLDGAVRRDILLARKEARAECLLALDDEAYICNKMAIRLSILQEHFMILRAIERGVPEARIARALNVRIDHIRQRQKLLRGICPEAVQLLKDKPVNSVTLESLRKMRAPRQIEACGLMVAASNYSSAYARALLAASPDEGLLRPQKPGVPAIVTGADLALMERELKDVQAKASLTHAAYGRDMLDLVIAARYVGALLANPGIARYLDDNHPEIAREFRSIVPASLASPELKTVRRGKGEPAEAAPGR